jgi:nucleoside-diphosphate-sugar epimerase
MKLTIIAATGGVGRQLLAQALDAGHDVTAVARNPAKLPPRCSPGALRGSSPPTSPPRTRRCYALTPGCQSVTPAT